MKKIWIAAAALVFLLLGVVLIAPSFVDWNNYKDEIGRQVSSLTGREASIGGDISFAVLPSSTLFVEDLRVASLPGASSVDFLTVRSLEVEVALLPLLRGAVQVERLILVDPTIELEVLPDGTKTWEFENDDNRDSGDKVDISLDRFVVENGRVSFKDDRSGAQRDIDDLNAIISARSLEGPFDIDAQLSTDGRSFSIQAEIGRLAGRPLTPINVTLVSERGTAKAEFAGALLRGGDSTKAEGRIKVEGDHANDVLAELMDPSVPNAEPLGRLGQSPVSLTANAVFQGDDMRLDKVEMALGEISGRGALSVSAGDEPTFKLLLTVGTIDLEKILADREPAEVAEAEESVAKEQAAYFLPEDWAGNIELTVGAIKYGEGVIRQTRLAAALKEGVLSLTSLGGLLPGGSDLAITGAVSNEAGGAAFAGKLNVASSNFRALLTWLNVDTERVAKDRLTQMTLSGALTVNPDLVQLYGIELALDTTRLKGGVAWSIQERTSFSANLEIDRLDLDGYFGTEETDEELGLDWIKSLADFDSRLKLDVARLSYDRFSLHNLAVEATLIDGRLSLDKVDMGSLNGVRATLTGSIGDLAGDLDADLEVTASTRQMGRLAQLLDLPEPAADAAGSPLNAVLALKGGYKALSFDGNADIGQTKLIGAGDVAEWREEKPKLNVRIDIRNASLANFAGQWDLDSWTPLQGADAPVALKGTFAGNADSLAVNWGAELAGGSLSVTGSVQNAFEAPAYQIAGTAKAQSFAKLFEGVGVRLQDEAKLNKAQDFQTTFRLDGSPERVRIEAFSARIGLMKLDGTADVALSGEKPVITASIVGTDVDTNPFLAEPATGPDKARDGRDKRWSKEPFNLSLLSDYDGKLTFKADKFRWRRYQFKDVDAGFSLQDGRLVLTQLTGALFGGDLRLAGSLSSVGSPALSLEIDFEEASLAQALNAAGDLRAATGVFSFSGGFTAKGDTQLAMISSLAGAATFSARDGIVRGLDLPKFSSQLLTLDEFEDYVRLTAATLKKGESRYKSVQASTALKDGVARVSDGHSVLGAGEATAKATFNLPEWTMDARVSVKLTDPQHQVTPAVSKWFRGSIGAPRVDVQSSDLDDFVEGRLLSRVLGGKGDKTEGQARSSGLRDLLGGSEPSPASGPPAADEKPDGARAEDIEDSAE